MKYPLFLAHGLVASIALMAVLAPQTVTARTTAGDELLAKLHSYTTTLLELRSQLQSVVAQSAAAETDYTLKKEETVPFYSQFTDISAPAWRKVGCGIASVAMLIDYYSDEPVNVDSLLETGLDRGAYLSDAGWTHAGLIGLARDYGLRGESRSLSGVSLDGAFDALTDVVEEGPVMVSVHYTFEPTNPIPHLVVVHGIEDGVVHYNDPAEQSGYGTISAEKFKRAWKQRYISIRPSARLAAVQE